MIKSTQKGNYKILELNRGRANPINIEMVIAIRNMLREIEQDDSIHAIIWKGNTDGFFSVGLDLKELYQNDEARMQVFFVNWEAMVHELAAFSKPMIAAINGYSPAGGCVLAMTCDYRLMAKSDKFVIGLNEIGVGITVPEYIFHLSAFWIGSRKTYQNIMTAKLMSVQEAFECGLVNEVHEMQDLLPAAEKYVQQLLRAPQKVLVDSKSSMRRALLEKMKSGPPVSIETKIASWFHPKARALMGMVVERLNK